MKFSKISTFLKRKEEDDDGLWYKHDSSTCFGEAEDYMDDCRTVYLAKPKPALPPENKPIWDAATAVVLKADRIRYMGRIEQMLGNADNLKFLKIDLESDDVMPVQTSLIVDVIKRLPSLNTLILSNMELDGTKEEFDFLGDHIGIFLDRVGLEKVSIRGDDPNVRNDRLNALLPGLCDVATVEIYSSDRLWRSHHFRQLVDSNSSVKSLTMDGPDSIESLTDMANKTIPLIKNNNTLTELNLTYGNLSIRVEDGIDVGEFLSDIISNGQRLEKVLLRAKTHDAVTVFEAIKTHPSLKSVTICVFNSDDLRATRPEKGFFNQARDAMANCAQKLLATNTNIKQFNLMGEMPLSYFFSPDCYFSLSTPEIEDELKLNKSGRPWTRGDLNGAVNVLAENSNDSVGFIDSMLSGNPSLFASAGIAVAKQNSAAVKIQAAYRRKMDTRTHARKEAKKVSRKRKR